MCKRPRNVPKKAWVWKNKETGKLCTGNKAHHIAGFNTKQKAKVELDKRENGNRDYTIVETAITYHHLNRELPINPLAKQYKARNKELEVKLQKAYETIREIKEEKE